MPITMQQWACQHMMSARRRLFSSNPTARTATSPPSQLHTPDQLEAQRPKHAAMHRCSPSGPPPNTSVANAPEVRRATSHLQDRCGPPPMAGFNRQPQPFANPWELRRRHSCPSAEPNIDDIAKFGGQGMWSPPHAQAISSNIRPVKGCKRTRETGKKCSTSIVESTALRGGISGPKTVDNGTYEPLLPAAALASPGNNPLIGEVF